MSGREALDTLVMASQHYPHYFFTITLRVICNLEQLHLLLGCGPDNGIWTPDSKDLLGVSKACRAIVSESQLVQRAPQK